MTAVLQIIPSLDGGGAEQACIDIAAALVQAGNRAIVVSSGGRGVAKIIASGAEHIQRNVASKNPLMIVVNGLWLARLVRKQNIAILHARSRAPAWSALIASRLTGCAFVTTFHAAYKFSGKLKKFYNRVMARGDRVIAISQFIASHIRKNYGVSKNVRVVPRGVDLDRFVPELVSDERCAALRKAWGVDANTPLVLCPARLSPIKGQAVLIEAMALLPRALNGLTAIIVGSDQGRIDYRRELKNLIKARELKGRVKLVDHCDDMPAALKTSSLVVATSLVAEGFGRVPVEAMSMGVPVIATRMGGFNEIIQHGVTGWLVPPNEPIKLAAAMGEVFSITDDAYLALLTAAMDRARRLYDKRQMAAATLAVYAELLGRRKP